MRFARIVRIMAFCVLSDRLRGTLRYILTITDSGPCARRRWLRDRSRSRLGGAHCAVIPQKFREFAQECLRWADETKSERHRQVLLEMARTWMEAALQLERSWALIDDSTLPSRSKPRASKIGPA
jgi:hypothetical protein